MKTTKRMLAVLLVLAITVAFALVTSAADREEIVMDFSNTTISEGTVTANRWHVTKDDISLITTPGYTVYKEKTYPSNWRILTYAHVDSLRNPDKFLQVHNGEKHTVWPLAWMAGSGNQQLAVSFTVPEGGAGYYVPNLSGLTIESGADQAVYVDNTFVGNYNFYNANSPEGLIHKSGAEKSLNAVYLSEGTHNVFMRNITGSDVPSTTTSSYVYLKAMRFVPIGEAPGFSGISTNLPETIKVGETADFTIGVDMTDGTKKFFGFGGNAGKDTANNISYQILSGNDILADAGNGEIVASYDEGIKGTITAAEPGQTTIKITAVVDGTTYTEEKTISVIENNPNAVTTNPNVAVYIGAENADASLITVIEGGISAGQVNGTVARNTKITVTANEDEDHEFLYWMDNAKRYIQGDATYTFTVGTNAAIFAVYADKTDNLVLIDYFTDYGTRVASFKAENADSVTAPEIEKTGYTGGAWVESISGEEYVAFTPDFKDATRASVSVTLGGNPYVSDIGYGEEITVDKTKDNFVCWKKNDKVVSFKEKYTFCVWNTIEALTEVTEGKKSEFPAVALFKNGSNYMLELVNCEGVKIIEKGILFEGTIDSCQKKFVSRTELPQFTIVEDSLTDAKAYVIYRDGSELRVAYSN